MAGLLVAMFGLFVSEKLPVELTAMSAFGLVLVFGLIPADKALAVFSNPGPIAVGAMFVLSAALERCGAIDMIAGSLSKLPVLKLGLLIPVIILFVGLISAFVNNTPVVVVFLPVVIGLAKQMDVPASKLLIPLSYAAILGGTCTLIGTSTNIIVSSIAVDAGYPPFGMFELAAVGIPLILIATVYLGVLGPRLLPVRETISSILSEEERREYLLEAFIAENSPLVGTSVREGLTSKVKKLRVLEVLRHGVKLSGDTAETMLQKGDRLLLGLSPSALARAQNSEGLDLRDILGDGLESISVSQGVIVEAVLGPDSGLTGVALAKINFRQRYRMVPLAVHRRGENLRKNFDKFPLQAGDTILLLGTAESIDHASATGDLLFLNRPPLILSAKRRKIPLIVAVIIGVVLSEMLGFLPIALAAIVGAVVLLLAQCLSPKEAFDSIQWPILFLIFGMLGVGAAMEETGTSAFIADSLVSGVGRFVSPEWQPFALLAGVYLITAMLTEILSNNAAAVLIATVVVGIASSLGVDPRPFFVAIAVAASASFATPIGYQTNTYVYGVGGYRFTDFTKVGLPLNFTAFVVAMVVIPMVWKF
ncbi:MAG: SLC13 family permease [Puniceicoccaceae bacterium]